MFTPQQGNWTEERVGLLKKMCADGLSSGLIGRELGVSRNAVIGKLNREGLSSAPTKTLHRGPRDRSADKDRSMTQRLRHKQRAGRVDGSLPLLVIEEPPPPADFRALTFEQIREFSLRRDNDCRFIRGEDDEKRYCGQPTPVGKSYCLHCLPVTRVV